MVKKLMDKIKDGVSVQEVEDFARKHTTEVFLVLSIVIASISSMYDFFVGPKLAIFFLALGLIFGVFYPVPVEKKLKQFYNFFYRQEKLNQFVLSFVQIVVSLFIPFIIFGCIGLLGGTSYHYYTRNAQVSGDNKSHKNSRFSDGEHH
jgi:hypothetical protein